MSHRPGGPATSPNSATPLMPPWQVTECGSDAATFYDRHFGMVVSAAGRHDSQTAYLHVDYRKITLTDEPLVARSWIDSVDGRKAFLQARMTDAHGNVLSEASGLMIKLLPHQP